MIKESVKLLKLSAKLESLYTAEVFTFGEVSENPEILIGYKGQERIELRTDSVKPVDEIRFITPRYEELFKVTNLDYVLFDGERLQVVWYDEYHFAFARNGRSGDVWHICQFAERFNESGKRVQKIEKGCTVL